MPVFLIDGQQPPKQLPATLSEADPCECYEDNVDDLVWKDASGCVLRVSSGTHNLFVYDVAPEDVRLVRYIGPAPKIGWT